MIGAIFIGKIMKKKKKSTFGTFYQLSPGDVDQSIERFNNSVQDGAMKTVCAEDLELREDSTTRITPQERQELKNLASTSNDWDAITSYINTKILKRESLEEDLFDDIPDVVIDTIEEDEIELPGPTTQEEFGAASLISEAIQNIWSVIDNYNSMLVSIDNEEIKSIVKDLVDDEMKNIARLEEAMTLVSPNAEHLKGIN